MQTHTGHLVVIQKYNHFEYKPDPDQFVEQTIQLDFDVETPSPIATKLVGYYDDLLHLIA